MEKKQNVPALRFQGFSGEWKTMFLGDMVEILSGIMGDSLLIDGKYRLTRIETIAAGIVDESRIGYTNSCPGDVYLLRKGDILYSNINSIEHIGKVAQYQGGTELYHGINLLRLIPGKLVLSDFLFQLLGTDKYRKWAKCHANQAVSQASINRTTLASQQISVCNIQEQGKIGNFLRQLDNNIVLTRKKIQKLQQFRQAMLAKLFPREGAAEPELRFRGFSGKWRIRTLAKCAALHARIGWQNLRKSEFLAKGDYYLITGTDFVDGQIEWRTCHYVSKLRYDQDKNIQVQNGDILVTKDGTLGKVAYVDGADKPATLNAGVFNVKINVNDVDAKYLYQYLKGPYLMDYVNQRATGGTIKHLNQNILVDFPVVMPSFEEQKIIGDFFYRLDRYISLQQKKLERMQRLKAALLEKLFV